MPDPSFDPPCNPPYEEARREDELVPFAREWTRKFNDLSCELAKFLKVKNLRSWREQAVQDWIRILDDLAEEAEELPEWTIRDYDDAKGE